MSLTVRLSGNPVKFRKDSFSMEDAIDERSTCSFIVIDDTGSMNLIKGMSVEVYDGPDLIFGGTIEDVNVKVVGLNGKKFHSVECIDNHYLADKRRVAASYKDAQAGVIIRDIVDDILSQEGITYDLASVQDGPNISEAVFNYSRCSDAISTLAERAGYWWCIDADKKLYFLPRTALTSPFTLTGSDILGEPSLRCSAPKYRNKEYVKGGRDLTDPQTQTFKGDGATKSFAMGYPIGALSSVRKKIGSTWYDQSVGVKGVDTGKDWYWSKGDPIIYQDNSAGVTPLSDTEYLEVTYQGEFDIVAIIADKAEVEDRMNIEGGTGIVENVTDEPDATTREAALQIASRKLQQYGKVGRQLKFATMRTGLNAGQLLTVNIGEFGLNNVQFLIERVSIGTDGKHVIYNVEGVDGPALGSWTKVFYNMATRGQTFVVRQNISEKEVLVLIEQFSEPCNWSEAVTPHYYSCPVPSVDLYPGETLYPC